jgi:hypothetical protein
LKHLFVTNNGIASSCGLCLIFAEEASRSQSECETEDGDSAVKLAEQQNLQQPEALNQSDEDTDVETPQDLAEQQTDAATVKPDSNMGKLIFQ